MSAIGVILAAGEGRRMGGPKALLVVDGAPLLRLHVERLFEAGCVQVVVVAPLAISTAVQELVPRARVIGARTNSQVESLMVGVGSIRARDVAVVTPVDLVPPKAATIRRLLSALTIELLAVTPQFEGHGGHPVVIRRSALSRLGEWSLHSLLVELGPRRLRLEVDDGAVARDLDVPADVLGAPEFVGSESNRLS